MIYRLQGRLHAELAHRLKDQSGQGTVEYVALLFLIGAVFTAVVGAGHGNAMGIPNKIQETLKDTLDSVGKGK